MEEFGCGNGKEARETRWCAAELGGEGGQEEGSGGTRRKEGGPSVLLQNGDNDRPAGTETTNPPRRAVWWTGALSGGMKLTVLFYPPLM